MDIPADLLPDAYLWLAALVYVPLLLLAPASDAEARSDSRSRNAATCDASSTARSLS